MNISIGTMLDIIGLTKSLTTLYHAIGNAREATRSTLGRGRGESSPNLNFRF